MKTVIKGAMMALALGAAAPVLAQSGWNGDRGWNGNDSGWNNGGFWQGAPSDTWRRIDFLQQRIQRGRADGSLTRLEAVRAQRKLDQLRREAWQMRRRDGGRMSGETNAWLQTRLDSLSREVRWARNNNQYADRDIGRFSTSYDARRYYRDGPQYRERRLSSNDEVFRGSDGRYYCKRSDGTTGLIVGAAGGALLGNVIDGGHNRAAGTLIGGALGAILGKTVDQNNSDVRCR